ncbi:SIMPL domain-containing protein [Arthrobacter cryoconiti]|uniref:SIMPL domain-containing protein n=1 Tax=Arthrobacter cryoconiti TaxID=748907 RepID=A0ABV8R2K2_9MICC|nr:SIMPL domain-containing protein [Arthrobacter cryoconiti]MCC9067270.1 SIMPL domain-containing protein [Arthrobacter cryoconiti]
MNEPAMSVGSEKSEQNGQTVSVIGRGTVAAAPDYFQINIGIEAQRPSVGEAYATVGDAMNGVQNQLLDQGVAGDAISTSSLDVRADSRWEDGVGSIVSGYTVSSTVVVRLRYDEAAEAIVAAVIDTGNNCVRLNALAPGISDPTSATTAARTAAWEDARRSAELYAALAGRSLGAVLVISEGSPHAQETAPLMARAMMSSESRIGIEPGQSKVSAAVSVTWELV